MPESLGQFKFIFLFQLNLKSPTKDDSEMTNIEIPMKSSEQRTKDPENVAKKGPIESPESFEKSLEKAGKTKSLSLLCLPANDEFFPRRSERIFLSSSSSVNSPTTTGGFEIPTVTKKKAKAPSGKVIKKKV